MPHQRNGIARSDVFLYVELSRNHEPNFVDPEPSLADNVRALRARVQALAREPVTPQEYRAEAALAARIGSLLDEPIDGSHSSQRVVDQ